MTSGTFKNALHLACEHTYDSYVYFSFFFSKAISSLSSDDQSTISGCNEVMLISMWELQLAVEVSSNVLKPVARISASLCRTW